MQNSAFSWCPAAMNRGDKNGVVRKHSSALIKILRDMDNVKFVGGVQKFRKILDSRGGEKGGSG